MLCLNDIINLNAASLQALVEAVESALTLTQIILAAWRLAMALAVKIVEDELTRRAQRPTEWGPCPHCGRRLRSKGFIKREMATLIGKIVWWRRGGHCPGGCKIGQVAPLDDELGLEAHQRTSFELKQLAVVCAVFLPFETAALFVKRFTDVYVSPAAVWDWVQDFGQRAMARLEHRLEQLDNGQLLAVEPLGEETAAMPLLIGGDGVMVPFRPKDGSPKGRCRLA